MAQLCIQRSLPYVQLRMLPTTPHLVAWVTHAEHPLQEAGRYLWPCRPHQVRGKGLRAGHRILVEAWFILTPELSLCKRDGGGISSSSSSNKSNSSIGLVGLMELALNAWHCSVMYDLLTRLWACKGGAHTHTAVRSHRDVKDTGERIQHNLMLPARCSKPYA